jgi:hypothetical protein
MTDNPQRPGLAAACQRRPLKPVVTPITDMVVFVPLLGVNFFPFLQAQGDRHRLA